MNWKALWLAVLLACGRWGFDGVAPSPDGAPAGMLSLRVLTDDNPQPGPVAGLPISGVSVLIDRGTGVYERIATDDAGMAQFAAAGVLAFHVVYHDASQWRIYTVAVPGVRELELGGREFATQTMTVTMPAGLANDRYTLQSAIGCGSFGGDRSPVQVISYRRGCEGKTVRALLYAMQPGDGRYLDAGALTLSNGTSRTLTGTYQPLVQRTIEIDQLPASVTATGVQLFAGTGPDLTELSALTANAVQQQGQRAVATVATVPGSDTMNVSVLGPSLPGPAPINQATGTYLAAVPFGGAVTFDASVMDPLFDSIAIDTPHPLSLTWGGGGTRGTLIAVEVDEINGAIQWRAFLPASATAASFPALPPDLGVPTDGATFGASVVKYDVPGATAAELIRTLDRAAYAPYDAPLLWSIGAATTTITASYGVR